MKITKDSYIEKRITSDQLEYIIRSFDYLKGSHIVTFELPAVLGSISCSLYGPVMNDAPITEDQVIYEKRGNRKWLSRMINRSARQINKMTIVTGPHEDESCILYAAFSGPLALREEGDCALRVIEALEKWDETHTRKKLCKASSEETTQVTQELHFALDQLKASRDFWSQHALTIEN